MSRSRKALYVFLRIVFFLYLGLFCFQRFILFQPHTANRVQGPLQPPVAYHLADFREVYLDTEDHVRIMGWLHDPAPGMPVVLYLHGNAMHIAGRSERYRALAQAGFGVMALSYRGYGKSEGSPSEHGLYSDARAAIAFLNNTYKNTPVIAFGESLGTGVAVEMAAEGKVAGLVLQSPYTSIATRAGELYWFLPGIKYLALDPFDSLSKIAQVHVPLLIFHGDRDNVVPFKDGKLLAESANQPVRFVPVPGAGHTNIPDALVVSDMVDFFSRYGFKTSATIPKQ